MEGWQSGDCTCLESRQAQLGFVGSNPTPSEALGVRRMERMSREAITVFGRIQKGNVRVGVSSGDDSGL